MKLLVIRFSSIGDIVLMSPVFRCIKQQMPGVELHFLCKKAFKDVTIGNPYIDQFHYFDGDLNATASELKACKFNYIIDLHKNLRTLRLRFMVRSEWLSFKKLSVQKFLLTKFHINLMPGRHITLRSLDALKPLGIKDDGKGLDYFIPGHEKIQQSDLPASHYFGYVVIVMGASYSNKKLPVNKVRELCQKIEYPIVLVGGPKDVDEALQVAELDPVKIYNACGKFSLNGSADIVRGAKVVVSNDTGFQYIACAFNKKVIAVWGGTSPLLDVEPFYGTDRINLHINAVVPGLRCQPCSNYGMNYCPKKHFKCMKEQDVDNISVKTYAAIKG